MVADNPGISWQGTKYLKYEGRCYYMDGSAGVCLPGFAYGLAPAARSFNASTTPGAPPSPILSPNPIRPPWSQVAPP